MGDHADELIGSIVEKGWSGPGATRCEKTCWHCGKRGLSWGNFDGKWRLANAVGELHVCEAYLEGRRCVAKS